MIKNKNYKLINLKYFFYFIIFIFFVCIQSVAYAEKTYNFDLLSRNDFSSPKINDLKQFLINQINQKRILVDDKDKTLFLKNMSLAKIIDKSSNFPSDASFFMPGNKYYFVLGIPPLVRSNDNLLQKYKFSFIYENRFSKILKITNLGTFNDFNIQTIINQIKNLNPILNKNELRFDGIPNLQEAIITSKDFEGKVLVTYNIKKNTPQHSKLKDFLKKTELGILDEISIQTIINKIKNLNPMLNKNNLQVEKILSNREAIIFSQEFEGKVSVTYNIKKNTPQNSKLKDFLTKTELGNLDEISIQTIINKIKNLNPMLNQNNLQVEKILSNREAIIFSQEFEGKVSVTYNLKQNTPKITKLKDFLTKTELGTLDEISIQTIINKIKNLNPMLNKNNLQVETILSNREAIIFSQEFEGKVSVTYNLKQNTPQIPKLKDFLTKTELGTLDEISIQTIINKIKNLNPMLNKNNLQVETILSNREAIIFSQEFEGKVSVTYNLKQNTPQIPKLKDFLTKTELGTLDDFANQTIIDKIQKLNPNLNSKKLRFDGIPNLQEAIITSKDFEGKVLVTYNIKKNTPQHSKLKDFLKKTELGILDEISIQTIINKIKNLNPMLNKNNLQVEKILSNREAIIFSQEFEGKVSVTYNIKKNTPQNSKLKDFLTKTELGTLDEISIQTIINKIKNLNPMLNQNNLQVEKILSNREAIIFSQEFEGKVSVTYNLKQNTPKITKLNDFLTKTELGTLDEISIQTIIDKIKNLNPNLNSKNLRFDGIPNLEEAIITSKDFEGKVSVTYNIKKNTPKTLHLIDFLKKTELGTFNDFNIQTIINQIKNLNPILNKNELRFDGIPNLQEAIITSKDFEGKVLVTYNIKKNTPQHSKLKDFLKKTELGILDEISIQTIINKIKNLNPMLNKNNLQVEKILSNREAIIFSQEFEGKVSVTYHLKQNTPKIPKLKDFLTKTELGTLDEISIQTIINKIKNLNPILNKNELRFDEIPNLQEAIITSKDFEGKVLVTYNIKTTPSQIMQQTFRLRDVLKTTKLGILDEINNQIIIAKIKNLNPILDQNNLQVDGILNPEGTIIVSKDFEGKVSVTFDILEQQNKNNLANYIIFIIIFLFVFILLFLIYLL
ncbi:hypothetical protein CWO85_02285 [Candidatus Phytoplasma ziziphi]|uniref:Uncharacterized protein n=1 Tax=Ziziphus jujuba witches'-broom phytoplasma TaxID=135727 RepID=A0A660HMR1_ZIZJU|nr:hypothetical protein [Candidatus Phytoplasma ziziphi]AYJ01323.1 hypothetical protein CWO85_02285 [Candidatus Phytoplasma ziziphi]